MQPALVLLSLLALLVPSALAGFFSDDSDAFDDGVGVGGIGSFAGDDLLDRTDWKGKHTPNDGRWHVKSWSRVESKGYPKKKPKVDKIVNDQKKWEQGGGGGKGAGTQGKGVKGGKVDAKEDEPFGKEFDAFVGVD
ncbi:hypothetical protein JCM11491_007137 [Sporobolomyces phaffii]